MCPAHQEKFTDKAGGLWPPGVQWEGLPPNRKVPRPLTAERENYQHQPALLGDVSGTGASANLCAVVTQPSEVNMGLVTAKVRLAKQGLSIPEWS